MDTGMIKDEYYYPEIEIKNGWTLEFFPGIPDSDSWGSFDYYANLPLKYTQLIEQCEKILPELAKIINDWLLPTHDVKFYLDGFNHEFIINHKETRFLPSEKKVILAVGSHNFEMR